MSDELDRLKRTYDWLRIEQQGSNHIACGGIFPPREIKPGQRWQGSSGHVVTVDLIEPAQSFGEHWVTYSWEEKGARRTHDKTAFAFQCRYCLVLPEEEERP